MTARPARSTAAKKPDGPGGRRAVSPAVTSRPVAVAPSAPRVVYAPTFSGAAYPSGDRGHTFRATRPLRRARWWRLWPSTLAAPPRMGRHPFPRHRPFERQRTQLAHLHGDTQVHGCDGDRLDPTKPRVLYAALDAVGVYKSVDSGATWTRSRQGIAATSILGLALDRRRPSTLYAGGLHARGRGGVWRRWQVRGRRRDPRRRLASVLRCVPVQAQLIPLRRRAGRRAVRRRPVLV
jgi:hypothetical protein